MPRETTHRERKKRKSSIGWLFSWKVSMLKCVRFWSDHNDFDIHKKNIIVYNRTLVQNSQIQRNNHKKRAMESVLFFFARNLQILRMIPNMSNIVNSPNTFILIYLLLNDTKAMAIRYWPSRCEIKKIVKLIKHSKRLHSLFRDENKWRESNGIVLVQRRREEPVRASIHSVSHTKLVN